jgi:hypothetical protein
VPNHTPSAKFRTASSRQISWILAAIAAIRQARKAILGSIFLWLEHSRSGANSVVKKAGILKLSSYRHLIFHIFLYWIHKANIGL